MKLGMTLKTATTPQGLDMDLVLEAERLGFHSCWAGEAYSADAVTPVAWVLARTTKIKAGTSIMQMSARTPAMAAMTAMTLQALSGNRFLCGIGPSGPQVIEGWHGQPYGKPLTRTREYVSIIRQIFARRGPLEHDGEHYQIPYRGPDATGLGKSLKSVMHPDPDLKIFMASISPVSLRTAGEIADGILPIFMSPERAELVTAPVLQGMADAASPKSLAGFDIAPYVRISIGSDVAVCRNALRPELALYIGGMGARSKNFYNNLARRMGYESEAATIQELYLGGKKDEATAAVPDRFIDETCLVGPPARIRDRLRAWQELARQHKIGTLILVGATREALRVVAEAVG